MAVPGFDGYFDDSEQNAYGGQETLGALPALLVVFHAAFEVGDAAAVAVAGETVHLRFENAQVAEDLRFEFIHHAHERFS
jgi:hypothetical protein